MAKKIIDSTFLLEKKRRHLNKVLGWTTFGIFLFSAFCGYFIQICVIHSIGHYCYPFFITETSHYAEWQPMEWITVWAKYIPYFDQSIGMYSLGQLIVDGKLNLSVLYRWLTTIGISVLSMIFCLIWHACLKPILKKKYARVYLQTLGNVTDKYYQVNVSSEKVKKSSTTEIKDFNNSVTVNSSLKDIAKVKFTFADTSFLKGYIASFKDENGKSFGTVLNATIPNCVNDGFIQFRNFGRLSSELSMFDENIVDKYKTPDFGANTPFVCYSSVGKGILKVVDKKFFAALADLANFVNCGVCVTIERGELQVYFDKLELQLAKKFSKKLPDDYLETQALTLNTLLEKVKALAVSLVFDNKRNEFITYKENSTAVRA